MSKQSGSGDKAKLLDSHGHVNLKDGLDTVRRRLAAVTLLYLSLLACLSPASSFVLLCVFRSLLLSFSRFRLIQIDASAFCEAPVPGFIASQSDEVPAAYLSRTRVVHWPSYEIAGTGSGDLLAHFTSYVTTGARYSRA